MKCLTVHQPWATLIAQGYKRVENRTWRTAYRGPLAIHAGLKIDPAGFDLHHPRRANQLARHDHMSARH